MKNTLLKWAVGPLAVAALAAGVGRLLGAEQHGSFMQRVASLSDTQRQTLEALPARTVTETAWALGDVDSVKSALKAELDALPEGDSQRRAQLLLRFGAIDSNPDGQAAVFSAACSTEPSVCDNMRAAVERETKLRRVAPGNTVPLSLEGGHPPIVGP